MSWAEASSGECWWPWGTCDKWLPVTLQRQPCPEEGPGVLAARSSHGALAFCRPAASLPSSSALLPAPTSLMPALPRGTRPATWLPS